LFLCECSFYDEQPGMHINYQTLRAHLGQLQCKRLVLTHLGEAMLARKSELAGIVAEDGMAIRI
jgi:ribonuclease BN (tRNA processing enzyme)